ncbi:hypothetical protein AT6N2_C2593 [Agrobacterium tumefaciens]|nr:hypothetical protein AT6N2_C2593 [Agrobacterium tumefaciens]
MLQQVFRGLETFRKLFANGLLDDALAGEADFCTWLGDVHIAQHRVGGGDAARRRVGQNHDIRHASFFQHIHCNRGAGQLHQRQNAFLHARATGGREHHKRAALGNSALECLHDGFAGGDAERAAHELEFMHDGDDLQPLQQPNAGKDRIVLLRLCTAVAQAIGIFLGIAKFQRVLRHLRLRQSLIDAAIEKIGKARLCRHLHMIAGRRDNPLVVLKVLMKDHLAGFGALDPEVLRNLGAAAEHGIDPRPNVIGDPVQLSTPDWAARLFRSGEARCTHAR